MNSPLIRNATLTLTLVLAAGTGALAQDAAPGVRTQPQVLETKSSACSPRDAASGQATGRRSHIPPSSCDSSSSGSQAEQAAQTKTSGGKHIPSAVLSSR